MAGHVKTRAPQMELFDSERVLSGWESILQLLFEIVFESGLCGFLKVFLWISKFKREDAPVTS